MTINHNGYKIWKASSNGKDEKAYAFRNKIIMAVIIVCVVMFLMSFILKLQDAYNADSANDIEQLFVILVLSVVTIGLFFIFVSHKMQQKPKRYAFIKSPYGEMYIIDYNTPFLVQHTHHGPMGMGTTHQFEQYFMDRNKSAQQIDMINRMEIFEKLADRNMIMPYGKKIMCVHSIKNAEMVYYISLTVTDGQYAPHKTRVFLPHNYPDLDELITLLKTLKTSP